MDCSTDNVARESAAKDSSGSDEDDFIPLSKLLMRPQSEGKKSCDNTHSSNSNSKKDDGALDDSDDEPLIKTKKVEQDKKENTPPKPSGTQAKTADSDTDDDSDNEPLIKMAKVSSKATRKPSSVTPKRSVNRKKKASLDKDESSDDEPLSEVAKKLQPQHVRKASAVTSKKATPLFKSKRTASRKTVKYVETSSEHSSEDEPLVTIKKKRTDAPKGQKTSLNKRTVTKRKDKILKDPSSSDSSSHEDDVPLANLVAKKKKPVKKNTKKSTISRGRASKKRQELSDESSDDEPLINLVKKSRTDKQTKSKTKAPTQKKNTATKKPRKIPVPDLSSNSLDDEAVTKTAKHPQVTKMLTILLERCDVGDAGSAASLKKKTRTGQKQVTDKPTKDNSEGSEESSEEE